MPESFLIAEVFVPKEELLKVAKAILAAQNAREYSWDPNKKYTIGRLEAAHNAVEQYHLRSFWVSIINMWNTRMHNDCRFWATKLLLHS